MIEVRQTQEFSGWLHRLRDANAVVRILGRIRRMELGNLRAYWKCASTTGQVTVPIMCTAAHRF
jgi:putative component of toxin-antitoxin plasmid stabilization module